MSIIQLNSPLFCNVLHLWSCIYSVNHYSTTLKVHRTRTTLDDDIFPGPPWRATLLLGTNLWKANICTWERFALNGSILKTQNNLMPPDAKNCRTDHTVWKLYNFPFHNFMIFFLLSIFIFLQNCFILPIFVGWRSKKQNTSSAKVDAWIFSPKIHVRSRLDVVELDAFLTDEAWSTGGYISKWFPGKQWKAFSFLDTIYVDKHAHLGVI